MANMVDRQAPSINEHKMEESDPAQQYPAYQSWPQHQKQYPGYHTNPWYSPHAKQEYPPQTVTDFYQQGPRQYAPKYGPPQYSPQKGPSQYSHQHLPYFNPYAPEGFSPQQGSWNPYNYNTSMPVWNNQHYYPGWQQFPQHQNQQENLLQDKTDFDENIKSEDVKPDNFHQIVSSELDHSTESTSDLGSSLNNSSGGESPGKVTVQVKLTSSKRPRNCTEWEEDEKTLLVGWKKRSYQHGIVKKKTIYQYLSPTQEIFETRTQMVEHLKSSGYSGEDVNKVVSGLRRGPHVFHDWLTDKSLPIGWKKRLYEWTNSNGRKAKKFTYMSPTSRLFTSRTEIVSFMKDSSEYSESDAQKVISGRDPPTKKYIIQD